MLHADDMLLLLIEKSIINLVRTADSIWILIVLKINLDKSIFKLTVMWSIKFEWFALLDFKWSIWQNKCKYGKAFSFALFSKVEQLTILFSAFKKKYKKENWKGNDTKSSFLQLLVQERLMQFAKSPSHDFYICHGCLV